MSSEHTIVKNLLCLVEPSRSQHAMTTHKHTTGTNASQVVLRVRSIAKLKRRLNALKIGHDCSGLIQVRHAVGININTYNCVVECEPLCSKKKVTQFYRNFYLPFKRKIRFLIPRQPI